jgi:hypothetical protein
MNRKEYLSSGAIRTAPRGMELPHTKLPDAAIREIRAAAEERARLRREITERLSNAALARKWRVHHRTIEKVLSYQTARHVP